MHNSVSFWRIRWTKAQANHRRAWIACCISQCLIKMFARMQVRPLRPQGAKLKPHMVEAPATPASDMFKRKSYLTQRARTTTSTVLTFCEGKFLAQSAARRSQFNDDYTVCLNVKCRMLVPGHHGDVRELPM